MTSHNLREAFDDAFARRVDGFASRLGELDSQRRPVMVDGRLHRREWLRAPDGRIVRLDAHDHAAAHDCIGAQDVVRDVVGAATELGLDEGALLARVRPGAGADFVRFHQLADLAFQLGLATFAGADGEVRRCSEALRRSW